MAIFKCKMCGGQLEVSEGMTVCECEYCGTQQTLPKNHDDVLTNLFNRANNLRMKSEFDKAQEIYEKIVANNATESEAYWGIVLCKYGIEYVEDPATLAKVPTCHRTQLESVMTDVDYQAALDNSDTLQRSVYEREAAAIDKLQKDILAIVHKEKPFDVFICYKESDENGKRTPDSVIANDIYHQLTQEGFKVFYAAITLEDKLGQEYEPYIFAALNSAKVMLAVGTKPEYFNAVWVKNEWSRYLKLMKSDRSRLLIPCYRDMDAYDLPEEFSHLQAQDMGKIGFVNDVIRGIRKVLVKDEPKPAAAAPVPTVVQAASANVENLLKRGNLALEDGKWEDANNFFEQVLNENVEEPRAYYGKMLADLNIRSSEHLEKMCYEAGISDNDNYRKAMRFGDDAMKQNLETLHKQTIYNYAYATLENASDRNGCMAAKAVFEKIPGFKDSTDKIGKCDEKANEIDYAAAFDEMQQASGEQGYKSASLKFKALRNYKDSAEKAKECRQSAEDARKDSIYKEAKAMLEYSGTNNKTVLDNLTKAKELFESIPSWKDSDDLDAQCRERIMEIQAAIAAAKKEAERREKRKARLNRIIAVLIVLGIAGSVVTTTYIIPTVKYNNAVKELKNGNYDSAISTFESLNSFKDSKEKVSESRYKKALQLVETQHYDEAKEIFADLGDYKDSSEQIGLTDKEQMYVNAVATYNAENRNFPIQPHCAILGKTSKSK